MTYSYKAFNINNNEIIKGKLQALDKEEAVKKINSLKMIPFEIKESVKEKTFKKIALFKLKTVKREELMVVSRELSVMLKAGVPILRALRILTESNRDKKLGEVLESIYQETKRGESLASSLEKEKRYFSNFFISMVKTGEKSGQLPEVLLNISKDLEHSLLISSEIKNALAYPFFLLMMSGFALFFIFVFVIPKFTAIIEKMDIKLPFYSQVILNAGTLVKEHFLLFFVFFLILIYSVSILRKNKKFKYLLNRLLLRTPLVSRLLVEVELSKFSHALSILLSSGVEIISSIRMAVDSMGNTYLKNKFSEVPNHLKRGESLHDSIKGIGFFPTIAVNMIEVGEETGRLSEILEEISLLFMEKFKNYMKRFISLLEPIIITIVGIIIGFIVISLLSAIMSLNEIRF
jgi:type II secretory pathway component PulF